MYCTKCKQLIESETRHDFVTCDCGNFTDGGHDYVRQGGKLEDIIDASIYENDDGTVVDKLAEWEKKNE